ncbi:Proteasome-associated protein ECM29-like protein [Operophtera brumata]|uniref:Proteasome-associated protein ECM29-like protein n=1 Tax=Operophtera brumata TaxID=104452 RepID=A0A0L7LG27_OPEBR|nr:Proteasome-associated protein ECM29-like protein [Operophtera brumata]
MSEMEVTEGGNDCSNDLMLLDRVFLRLGNADSDEQLESCLNRFLPPVILKLSSPHEQVRKKVMELLIHVNKRMKCRAEVQLPVQTLLQLYADATSNSFIINFSIIYITMGFPRLPREQQQTLAPTLLSAIENKPQAHQDQILMLVMPLLGEIKETNLNLKEKPKVASLILKALPNPGESEFQVPPGMSMKTYKRIIDKNQLNPNQLEEMKLSIVNFISKDIFNMNDCLLTLIIPACTRLRLKLIQYLNKATGPAIMFPHCVQVIFSSLFDPNTNTRLRNMALIGDPTQLKKVSSVFLQGLLKLIRSEEYADQQQKAYLCLGRLAVKCPDSISNQFALLEELVKKIPEAPPELKTALRDALLEMAVAYKITFEGKSTPAEPAEGPSSSEKMDVDDNSEAKGKPSPFDEPQALALFALLDHYMQSEESMIRYIAMRYSAAVFPQDYIPSRYLLLMAKIEDVVNNVSRKETTSVNIDGDSSKSDRDKTEEVEYKVPQFKDMVNYIWDQMQRRKKGSNAKHRFVVSNQDCSNHPNASSPLLAKYFYENLLDTEVLQNYLTMITFLLCMPTDKTFYFSDVMSLTCFLDIVGCVPEKIASKYTSLLPFLRNLFTTSTKEEIRDIAALIFAIITIKEFVEQGVGNKNLESQCGYVAAFAHMCERCVALSKRAKFGGKGFSPAGWEPYQDGAVCLGNSGLPLPVTSPKQDTLLQSDMPFNTARIDEDDVITKYTVAERLFKIVGNAKLPSKVKERSLFTLGLMCCGERLSFAKQIVMGFLQMAKDSKEFEIHLQIGESLVLCAEGVNSNENRDPWVDLPKEGSAKVKSAEALKENDELLEWLLQELFKINIVQDVASKGLSLVYQNSDESQRQALVGQIIEQLTSGKRSVAKVTEDTKIFEEGQLGTAPTGVMDDVHEGTRQAATTTATVLSKLCIRASDVSQGKDGKEIVSVILPVILDTGITNLLVSAAGDSLKPFLPKLIPALVGAAGDLESAKLSYLSTALADTGTREILELTKSPQLGTKVACCHFIVLAAHYLRAELEPVAGKIMTNLLNGTFDRNSTVRKNYAEALGQISAFAKPQTIEKLMKKLVSLYETKEDDMSRSAIALVLNTKEGETPLSPTITTECINALLVEARKQEMVYKKHAITALGQALAATNCDRFNHVYEIVKDEYSMGKDSDEEDNEGARQRREQLTALKEAAYELLGKAWPKDPETQVFFDHCANSYASSSRSTQLAILTSIARVLERLAVLRGADEPMDTDNVLVTKNSNQVRHRRDALNIMEILIKKLKDLNKAEELNKLKVIYHTYAQDLSKETSHEIRTKVDDIKVHFK